MGRLAEVRIVLATVAVAAGPLLLAGCSSPDSPSVVGTWDPVSVRGRELPENLDPNSVAITFTEDGTWTASDGCNEVGGVYRLDGATITIEPASGGGAFIGCIDGVNYLRLVPLIRSALEDEDDLVLEGANGPVLRLTRSDGG